MKKMVCEVCGSQSFKKENGVFICQECGIEYSVEEAKKLLVDIDSPIETKPDVKMADSDAGKYKLIKCLSLYAQAVLSLNMTKFWFDIDYTPSSDAFWIEMDSLKDYEPVLPRTKFSLDKDNKNTYYERFYLGDLERKTPIYLFTTSKFALLAKVILNNQDAKWQHIGIGGTVSKEDYNVSIQADDGSYNEKIHDMPRNVDGLIHKIAELSRTHKKYSLHRIIVKAGLFTIKNVDTKWEFTDLDVTKTISETADYVKALKEYDKAIIDRYVAQFPAAKEEYLKILNDIKVLEKEFFVPYKYRNPAILYEMVTIITSGRADTWKELVEVYETDAYRNKSLIAFNKIQNGLDNINRTLTNEFSKVNATLKSIDDQLASTNTYLTNINMKVTNMARGTDYIAFQTFWDHS